MSELNVNPAIKRLHIGPLQIGIILLTVITAGIHLYRALLMSVLRGSSGPGPGRGAGGGGGRGLGPGRGGPPGGGPGGADGPMQMLMGSLTTLFYLNALGYILLVIALYLPPLGRYHRIVRWLLIAFALVTIIAWFVITGARFNVIGYADKPVELLLIILLIIEDRQERLQRS